MQVADEGVRESGIIMHAGAVILLFLFASSGEERALPSEIDLRAAYCIPIVQNLINVLRPYNDDARSTESTEELITAAVAGLTEKLRRLKLYLLPRISYLEPLGLTTAMQRAQEDLEKFEQHGKSCEAKCKQSVNKRASAEVACGKKCDDENPLRSRFRDCQDLRWLPY